MPLYMEIHNCKTWKTSETENYAHSWYGKNAHKENRLIQDEYGVKFLQYWFNDDTGQSLCLVEGPNKEQIMKVHRASNQLLPNDIVKVEEGT